VVSGPRKGGEILRQVWTRDPPLVELRESDWHPVSPYFGGYVTENLLACRDALGLSLEEIVLLVRNGLEAAFVTKEERQILLRQLDTYLARSRSPFLEN